MILRTLGMKEVLVPHTVANLRQLIMDIAKLYGIDSNKIYSFITDNGTNMVKAV